jgi:starvation-inducible DNA-binding protein
MSTPLFTVPGMDAKDAGQVCDLLQRRLVSLIDLQLTLKHIHWNVVGPTFIGVHEMLDPQVAGVQAMVDDTAERIATLGGSPNGLAGNLVETRTWDDYSLGRALVDEHLRALDRAYEGVVADHRAAIEAVEELDKVTQDMLIEQSEKLERFHWFVRAHLESPSGRLSTEGSTSERDAAKRAGSRRRAS